MAQLTVRFQGGGDDTQKMSNHDTTLDTNAYTKYQQPYESK
jgi:hypothetical protein